MAGHSDGLDALLQELSVQQTQVQTQRSRSESPAKVGHGKLAVAEHDGVAAGNDDDDWDWDDSTGEQQQETRSTSKAVKHIAEQLRNYIHDIADSDVRESVNQELSRLSFRKFIQYYQESDQLAEYTIRTELPRMAFRVVRHSEQTDDKQQIEDIFDETPFDDIWRMANQSIFADILVALQRRYLRADLSVSIVSTTSSFTIDLDSNKLQALSVLHVTVPSRGGMTRLQLCSFAATVDVDLRAKTVQQVIGPPDLKFVFDEQILEAAEAIDMYTHSAQSGPLLEVDLQRAREQLMAVRKQLTHAGEGLLEGVVGSLGRIVGADQQHSRRGSNGAAIGGDDDGHVLRLYRRDADDNDKRHQQPTKPPASPDAEQAPSQETQPTASPSSPHTSGSFTPRSGGLFGTWFKVAEKVATVGQLGVQFALAVGEEVAKAAVRQASEEDEEAGHEAADAGFRFPRPDSEVRPSPRSSFAPAAVEAAAKGDDAAGATVDQEPEEDRSQQGKQQQQQQQQQQQREDDDKLEAAGFVVKPAADEDEDENSESEIAAEDDW